MATSILVSDRIEATYQRALDEIAPGVPRVTLGPAGFAGDIATVEIAFFSGDLYPARAREFWRPILKAPQLRWLHSYSAGVDDPVFHRLLARGVRVSTSSGASAVPIAHTIMLYILAASRDLRGWLSAQSRSVWEPHDVRDLQGMALGVVGLGPIGLEVARLGIAFGMRVIGMRRTPRGDEPCATWPLQRLTELATIVDYLVLALPLTPDTKHVIDAAVLACMKADAVLINVGRGELVDEPALITALTSGRLGGAALDVFEKEPLPADNPLWELRNVIVTPHSAGNNPGNDERATAIFLDNLKRYMTGEPLRNEVPPTPQP